MDISEYKFSVRLGSIKSEESLKNANSLDAQIQPEDLKPISSDVNDFKVKGHKVIFGNCLHYIPGGFKMWTSCNSFEACGNDCVWLIPKKCFVGTVPIGFCSDGCQAWAVEIRC